MRRRYKGIVGIEAAIVLIAFVIVAAALAFVTLNMGFFTTQKSKEAMSSSLEEASSALEVDGSVLGYVSGGQVTEIAIPIKLSSGKNPVDLNKIVITLTVEDKTVYINDININTTPNSDIFLDDNLNSKPAAFLKYVGDDDNLVEVNEKWVLVIDLSNSAVYGGGLAAYKTVVVEIKPPTGAPLTVERMIPPQLSNTVVLLG